MIAAAPLLSPIMHAELRRICFLVSAASLALSTIAFAADGEAVYRATCSTCHDSGAGGAPRTGRPDEWKDRFVYGRAGLHAAAIDGVPSTAMAAKGGFNQLSIAEVKGAVDFMLARTGFVEPAALKPRPTASVPKAVAANVEDAVITARVAAALRSQMASPNAPIDAEASDLIVRGVGIRVGTVSGVVRLMGVVQDAVLVKRAEAVVRAVEGVRGVDNRLVSGGMLDFD